MWTDMSEIVRPTRDGIHGREYISTAVDLGRKLNHLEFDGSGALVSKIFDIVDVPIPIIFDMPSSDLIDAQCQAGDRCGSQRDRFLCHVPGRGYHR